MPALVFGRCLHYHTLQGTHMHARRHWSIRTACWPSHANASSKTLRMSKGRIGGMYGGKERDDPRSSRGDTADNIRHLITLSDSTHPLAFLLTHPLATWLLGPTGGYRY